MTARAALLLSVAGSLLAAAPAPAGDYGGDPNKLVCGWIRQGLAQAEAQLNAPRLNDFLLKAADEGCATLVGELLDRGASVLSRDRFSNTALIHAAGGGHPEVVRLLLDRGSEIDHANLNGSTALARAIARNRQDVVALLRNRGASTRERQSARRDDARCGRLQQRGGGRPLVARRRRRSKRAGRHRQGTDRLRGGERAGADRDAASRCRRRRQPRPTRTT